MTNSVIHGDCLEVPLPPNQFDTLITDPPYGLSFMGKDWDVGVPGKVFWKKFLDACKPGAFAFVFGGTRTHHRLACAIEDAGWEIRDCMMWLYGSGFPKSHDIGKAIDKMRGNERDDLGKHPNARETLGAIQICKKNGSGRLTKGQSEWEGYGTALKPAWEPIIVAMKPLDWTFAHNAEKWGVGGLWIDGGRIVHNEICRKIPIKTTKRHGTALHFNTENSVWTDGGGLSLNPDGRWPANVILNEEAGAMLDEQTGEASRFFYAAKASRKEREAGLDALPEKLYARSGGGQGQVARGEDEYLEDSIGLSRISKVKNNHPTVKPLALMEYLCKLSRPPQGGIVLDPFAGSGTTALACVNTNRQYVVIEKEQEYCEIIAARLGGVEIETALPVSKHHSTDVQEPIKVQGCPPAPHENPSPNAEPGKASVVPPQRPLCSFCGGLLREAGTNWICLKCKKLYRHLI